MNWYGFNGDDVTLMSLGLGRSLALNQWALSWKFEWPWLATTEKKRDGQRGREIERDFRRVSFTLLSWLPFWEMLFWVSFHILQFCFYSEHLKDTCAPFFSQIKLSASFTALLCVRSPFLSCLASSMYELNWLPHWYHLCFSVKNLA